MVIRVIHHCSRSVTDGWWALYYRKYPPPKGSVTIQQDGGFRCLVKTKLHHCLYFAAWLLRGILFSPGRLHGRW
jgi:hypothetical protein